MWCHWWWVSSNQPLCKLRKHKSRRTTMAKINNEDIHCCDTEKVLNVVRVLVGLEERKEWDSYSETVTNCNWCILINVNVMIHQWLQPLPCPESRTALCFCLMQWFHLKAFNEGESSEKKVSCSLLLSKLWCPINQSIYFRINTQIQLQEIVANWVGG